MPPYFNQFELKQHLLGGWEFQKPSRLQLSLSKYHLVEFRTPPSNSLGLVRLVALLLVGQLQWFLSWLVILKWGSWCWPIHFALRSYCHSFFILWASVSFYFCELSLHSFWVSSDRNVTKPDSVFWTHPLMVQLGMCHLSKDLSCLLSRLLTHSWQTRTPLFNLLVSCFSEIELYV